MSEPGGWPARCSQRGMSCSLGPAEFEGCDVQLDRRPVGRWKGWLLGERLREFWSGAMAISEEVAEIHEGGWGHSGNGLC